LIDNDAPEPAALSPDLNVKRMDEMAPLKWLALCLAFLTATTICSAQHFPLRSGEWQSSMPNPTHPGGPPITMLVCMNDATWTKALNHNPTCSLQQLNITSIGGSYSLSCAGPVMQMKGSFKISFDGMTHMTSSGSMDITYNGQTRHSDATSDFHWKSPTCDPNVDMNLRDHSKPPQ
jgi:hypothetical protein